MLNCVVMSAESNIPLDLCGLLEVTEKCRICVAIFKSVIWVHIICAVVSLNL